MQRLKNVTIMLILAREEYKRIVDSGGVIRSRSLTDKDPELIRNVNRISQAVKVNKFTDMQIAKIEYPLDYLEENLMGQLPFEGRILIEEYYKALYLNDENPEIYNINYWQDYFKVTTHTLRNIFNYVFFPIPDEKSLSDVGKILYFKDAELAKRRLMISEMTGEEYKDYLTNTEMRPELEEIRRLDYIKYQVTSDEPRLSERTVPHTNQELDEALDEPLTKSPIMKEIDRNITNYIKATIEERGLELDKDVRIALEEIRKQRLAVSETKMIDEKKKEIESGVSSTTDTVDSDNKTNQNKDK
jgi:hypothetical protein